MPDTKLDADDFTIGIICALPFEFDACRLVLDETFTGPRTSDPLASSPYRYGRIGQHNVVIARLPEGRNGTVAARGAADNLCSAHPAVRMGILVGVGGGVPSADHDIRLGDVVVGVPGKRFGGVVQHDFVAAKPTGSEYRSFLNSPPEPLLTAVSAVHSDDRFGLTHFRSIVRGKTAIPNFADFKKPDQEDILFCPRCDQPLGQEDCESCQGKQRHPRIEAATPAPVVHYGTIASGNAVVRNAAKRDELYNDFGCLCIEMEGAGVMNSFPCLVVRGISNYCDSHKTDEWQKYAALTAAAWMHELLHNIASIDNNKARVPKEIIVQGFRPSQSFNSNQPHRSRPFEEAPSDIEESQRIRYIEFPEISEVQSTAGDLQLS